MESNKQYNNPVTATLTGIVNLFKKGESVGSLSPDDRLDGKRVMITGASSGLGLATAKKLAALGAEVIMAVRSGIPEKGEEVKRASGSDKVHMHHVDLSDFKSIDRLIGELKTHYGSIDIVVCNAGMVASKARKTPQGLEEMFMVNYLSSFYLLNKMLGENLILSTNAALPRIVIVDSESHRDPKQFEWDKFGVFEDYKMGQTVQLYGYYKLLLATFAAELSRRLNKDKPTVSVFALCPGPVNSNIAREAPALFKPLLKAVFGIFFRSPAKASEPVMYLSASSDVEGIPLDYLYLMQRKDLDEKALDARNGERLWKESEALVRKVKDAD